MNASSFKSIRVLIAVAAPLAATAIILSRDRWLAFKQFLPECAFHKVTGYLCPACGNTRCVECLIHGQLLRAFGYNITIPILLLVLFAVYAENMFTVLGKRVEILPRNACFWWVLGVIIFLYYFLRNFIPLSIA